MLLNTISFPGLGIGEFQVDPVAFRLPLPWSETPHSIMWYGIIITLAMVIGFTLALRKAKWEGIKSDTMFDLAIYLIIFCMIGARLYYVLSKPGEFSDFLEVIAVWKGGLAIYGGVIAGAATIFVYSRIKKISTAKMLDVAVPGLIIGQAIGRWGNFFNAEAHGGPTELPWAMGIGRDGPVTGYYHPTFLYESLWNVIGFILVMCFYKKKKYDGQPTLFYLVWYGVGRFFIEPLRTDSLYLLEDILGQTVRVSQLVAALCVIGGIIGMIICAKRAKEKAEDDAQYEEVYTLKDEAAADNNVAEYGIKEESEAELTNADADAVMTDGEQASGEN